MSLRIAQLIKGLDIGGRNGGAERFGAGLAAQLSQMGHTITLWSLDQHDTSHERQQIESLRNAGVEVVFGGPAHRPALLRMLPSRSWLARAPVDVLHSHFQVGSVTALMAHAANPKLKLVRTAHISREWGDGTTAAIGRALFTRWLFTRWMDAQAGVSQSITDQLRSYRFARRDRIWRIYNALPDRWFDLPDVHAAREKEDGPYVIGSVGRLTARKGYRDLLQAFACVRSEQPACELWLVGDGEERAELEHMAEAPETRGRVRFLGQRSDVTELLAQMDLFVLPSRWEGLPTVLLEAMAAGVPVIATDIPGSRELVQDGESGWLVPLRQPVRLAEVILNVLSNPVERVRRAKAARSRLDQFSMQAVAAQYIELYRHILT